MSKFQRGDYVQVIRTPDPWEVCGETLKDREAYLEHVGIVVEIDEGFNQRFASESKEPYDKLLVRFPCCVHDWEETHQRNIESFSLRLVSRPFVELDQPLFGMHG